jgi:hypothetical protein
MSTLRLKELLREFEASFSTYLDEARDVRFEILMRMTEQVSASNLAALFESYDFAALLTCAVFVDEVHAARCVEQRKQEECVPEEFLRGILVTNTKYPRIVTFIDELIAIEDGRIMLLDVVCCLGKAHKLGPAVSENLWKP